MKLTFRNALSGTPMGRAMRRLGKIFGGSRAAAFTTSGNYWEERYAEGRNSGAGSYGRLAAFKAEVLNRFVREHGISSVIEFGSGDGNQLRLAEYPDYLGIDVSETAVRACRETFAADGTKRFETLSAYDGQAADLALSLDVIYHLVEDDTFASYMTVLFDAAERFVIVYASNRDEQPKNRHVRHRRFSDWVEAHRSDFRLRAHIPNRYPFAADDPDNTSFADFFIYEKVG